MIICQNTYFSGKTILVVGGYEDNLNPEAVHFNEDGRVELERCENGIYERRIDAVGDFLDDQLVVCGGYGNNYELLSNCETGTQTFSLAGNQDEPISFKVCDFHVVLIHLAIYSGDWWTLLPLFLKSVSVPFN